MKRLNVNINDKEYQLLKEIAEYNDTSIATLLGSFIQDLTFSDRSFGSDERRCAKEWLDRSMLKYR